MAGWSTRGTDYDVGQRNDDASLILVAARDVSFYTLFSLALTTWWGGCSQACFAPATTDITGVVRLPISITTRYASSFYGQCRQFVAWYFKRRTG